MKNLLVLFLFFLSFAQHCLADPEYIKDWHWELSNEDYSYAGTVNEKDRMLAQVCYYETGSCIYMVSLGITCEKDAEYPSLVNSNLGADHVMLLCAHKFEGENIFVFKDFDKIDGIIKEANRVGFAIPVESGHFKVVRFSLSGSKDAIQMMRLSTQYLIENKSKKEIKSEEYL